MFRNKLLTAVLILCFAVLVWAAAGQGFLTVRPDARFGADYVLISDTGSVMRSRAERFTMPGSGPYNITEIGAYLYEIATGTLGAKFAIFTDDNVNDCPEDMVENSESTEVTIDGSSYTLYYHTYGTQPQLTGGTDYWLAMIGESGSNDMRLSADTTGGLSLRTDVTYSTWPTEPDWETNTSGVYTTSLYAIYEAAAGGSGDSGILLLGVGN